MGGRLLAMWLFSPIPLASKRAREQERHRDLPRPAGARGGETALFLCPGRERQSERERDGIFLVTVGVLAIAAKTFCPTTFGDADARGVFVVDYTYIGLCCWYFGLNPNS